MTNSVPSSLDVHYSPPSWANDKKQQCHRRRKAGIALFLGNRWRNCSQKLEKNNIVRYRKTAVTFANHRVEVLVASNATFRTQTLEDLMPAQPDVRRAHGNSCPRGLSIHENQGPPNMNGTECSVCVHHLPPYRPCPFGEVISICRPCAFAFLTFALPEDIFDPL